MSSTAFSLRRPVDTDGYALSQLIERCPPLDTNSVYCNLLQCTDFSATSIAAEGVRYLETTISPGNGASEALFAKAFRQLGVTASTEVIFSRAHHFNGQHDDEVLYRAGPFALPVQLDNQETV